MTHRIVSLLPSATEIVCMLGYEAALVGRSHECDFPLGIESLPVCSAPRINVSASSLDIDRSVNATLQAALSIYEVSSAQLEKLQPTLVVTQTQCDVCAVSVTDVKQALGSVVNSQPQIVSLSAMTLSDVWEDIRRVAAALGDLAAGQECVDTIGSRLNKLSSQVDSVKQGAVVKRRPTVACVEWIEPLMVAGNWVPELVELSGGKDLFGQAGQHSPYIDWDDLVRSDPDVILMMPCGFEIERTQSEMHLLTSRPEWESLSAVRSGQVYLTDGNQYFNRPGPRLVDSAEIIAEILHGQSQVYHNSGWVRFIGS